MNRLFVPDYMFFSQYITLPSTKEKDAEAVWTELAEIKKLVISPLEIGGFEFGGMHLAKRLLTYKFIESVIMCQSPRDPVSKIRYRGGTYGQLGKQKSTRSVSQVAHGCSGSGS